MANFNLGIDFEKLMAGVPTPTMGGGQIPNIGFPGLAGSQSVPTEKLGFFQNFQKNPELIAMVLDQLGGMISGQGPGLGTSLAKSSIANKAQQQQMGKLTPADQAGDTSTQDVAVPGGVKRTITSFIPSGTLGGALATHPLKPR
ncbi:hypothetical protein LCGC14_1787800 [marine sediment metagenome]|uniref:Uncharacterized protein n=1 Tax=marine sediment metagenome TaxID=412755 RepID=A0A0F9GTE7_9ZZZZ